MASRRASDIDACAEEFSWIDRAVEMEADVILRPMHLLCIMARELALIAATLAATLLKSTGGSFVEALARAAVGVLVVACTVDYKVFGSKQSQILCSPRCRQQQ